MIKKEYTKEGLKLTHPSGFIALTTLVMLRRLKDDIQAQTRQNEAELQLIGQDLLSAINAGAK